ncbi:hypothetical protein HWV07_16490 [Natronomonas salina]|uniref:HVO_0234 family beta-propeller protein n=1 Tax=Natronomonas salina TaxID=1710540 RepID=UPI0015B63EA6|nr:hypothetical protein [Natronomonas salina]QLD90547.1 hypothetical protein HWV07_16490 [Natronomonas salina]
MSDEDISIDEKRVYADKAETTTAFVATGVGVARVEVSDDIVGEFALEHRGAATDLAAADGRLAVATPEDVLVSDGESFAETGFGPADAVGFHDGFVAAGDGTVARLSDGEWTTLGQVEDVRSIDGDMVAAASGVHRLDGTHVGLDGANDVSTVADPLAATDGGLYYLANGWMAAADGAFEVVAGRADGRAHAATAESLYERAAEGEAWTPVDLPAGGPVADVAYGDATYAVTRDGTFLADAGDGWRHRSLGLPDVSAVAVVY